MAYTGTYEEELRKNPTDYKLRAMGKRRYNLRKKKDDRGKTKVTISTKDDPKTYPSYSEQAKGKRKSSSKSLLNRKGSGTQQTNFDKIRKPGQVGTQTGEKARESKSADARKGGKNTLLKVVGTPALLGSIAKIATDANKIGKKPAIEDKRKKLAITDRSKTMNVDKEGNVRQGSNDQKTKKEAPKKESKKEKAKRVAIKIKQKAKETSKKVLSKAKNIGKKVSKPLTKGLLKRIPGVSNLVSTKAGTTAKMENMAKNMSVAELKKMGLSDAQIKKLKGK